MLASTPMRAAMLVALLAATLLYGCAGDEVRAARQGGKSPPGLEKYTKEQARMAEYAQDVRRRVALADARQAAASATDPGSASHSGGGGARTVARAAATAIPHAASGTVIDGMV